MKARFISDNGRPVNIIDSATGRLIMVLPRYGVWADDELRGKPQVIDTGDDLDALLETYGNIPVIPTAFNTTN